MVGVCEASLLDCISLLCIITADLMVVHYNGRTSSSTLRVLTGVYLVRMETRVSGLILWY